MKLIGTSRAMAGVREEIEYASRCDAKVLVTGESGVGKEIVARLIHAGSGRGHHQLVTVNCAALTESLLETELFGHVRGSFTGAFRDRTGVLEQAHRGTVFMDEIGETTPRMQGLLLRFLETGEIQRVGSEKTEARVNVRVIAATNRNLVDAVAAKSFRDDLYYRLNVIQLHLPPLRERMEDVPALLAFFLTNFAEQYRVPVPDVCPDALAVILGYKWPGNVRELKNVAERLVVRSRDGRIEVADLPTSLLRAEPRSAPAAAPVTRSTAETLYDNVVVARESFWAAVYAPFMSRDITRNDLRALVRKGLEQTGGSYRLLIDLFNMPAGDYKRFLNFLRKHHCHVAFQQFRTIAGRPLNMVGEDVVKRERGERDEIWKTPA
ncbi:MAG TPA: sigma-54 dependent transcriptional regulator [Vicinamibacterales bacterium]|nr:sigma-54 dependent transcriptional regulator [Vicinamibacterales bacterium]